MRVDIASKEDLKRLLTGTNKPVSFLVGAPISWDRGVGVPPVSKFLDLIRERVAEEGPKVVEALETTLAEANGPNVYQRAMLFLQRSFDPNVAEKLVEEAVLSGRKPDAPPFDYPERGEGDPTHWHISRGIWGLARLVKAMPNRFTGPIHTTNFDPFIQLALGAVGMTPQRVVMAADGSIHAVEPIRETDVVIIHLHGYWRNSPTLHTPAQLTASRRWLQASLQRHLGDRTLVVMAYGGWDDIFTTALANCLNDEQFPGSVRWCFYGDNPAQIREDNEALFRKLEGGILLSKIMFYGGIDCHTIFDELINDLGLAPAELTAIEESPLVGWELISPAYLDALAPLSGAEAVRYFDGAVPTWRHAISPLIFRLSQVNTLKERLEIGLRDTAASTLQLIRAAGGEGKSTALLQVAADAARGIDWTVLWRRSTDMGLNPEVVATLTPDRNWLLVADDAEGLVDDLWACAERLHQEGRSNVFFLLAARDADWRGAKGDQKAWATRLKMLRDRKLSGIGEQDAEKVVDAWAEQGKPGLRALAAVASREERVRKLLAATRAQNLRGGDGSFIGGLLETRFNPEALRAHIASLMEPLRGRAIAGGTGTLYDALIYIAACHAVGIPGVDNNVLASLLDFPVRWVSSNVLRQLGAEIGAAESAGHSLTRHRRVAEAAIVSAEENFDTDLCDIWAALVEHTAKLGRKRLVGHQSHGRIIHAGARLKSNLPIAISEERRGEIGIAAAASAYEHQNEWLGVVIDRARAHRIADDPETACRILRRDIETAHEKVDFARNIRGYYHEWGTCAENVGGRQAHLSSVWLDCLSLSDQPKVKIELKQAKLSCSGLGKAFGEVQSGAPDCVFAKGRRAAMELGWRSNPDQKARVIFSTHDRQLDEIGAPKPSGFDEAIVWLEAAVRAAYDELADQFLRSLIGGERLTFDMLRARLPRA